MDVRALIFCVAVALLFVSANVLTERSLGPGRGHYMAYVCVLSVVAFFGFRTACQLYGLTVASAVVDTLLTLLTVGWGIFVLKEDLSTVQYVGIGFLLIGLLLVKEPWSGGKSVSEAPPQTVVEQEASP